MWINSKVSGSFWEKRRSLFSLRYADGSSNLMWWRTRRTPVQFLSWLYEWVAGLGGDLPKALRPFTWPVKSDLQIIQGILFHQKMLVIWLRETGFTVVDGLCPHEPVHQKTAHLAAESPPDPNKTRLRLGRQQEGRITTFDLWNNQITGLKHVNQVFHY